MVRQDVGSQAGKSTALELSLRCMFTHCAVVIESQPFLQRFLHDERADANHVCVARSCETVQ